MWTGATSQKKRLAMQNFADATSQKNGFWHLLFADGWAFWNFGAFLAKKKIPTDAIEILRPRVPLAARCCKTFWYEVAFPERSAELNWRIFVFTFLLEWHPHFVPFFFSLNFLDFYQTLNHNFWRANFFLGPRNMRKIRSSLRSFKCAHSQPLTRNIKKVMDV